MLNMIWKDLQKNNCKDLKKLRYYFELGGEIYDWDTNITDDKAIEIINQRKDIRKAYLNKIKMKKKLYNC